MSNLKYCTKNHDSLIRNTEEENTYLRNFFWYLIMNFSSNIEKVRLIKDFSASTFPFWTTIVQTESGLVFIILSQQDIMRNIDIQAGVKSHMSESVGLHCDIGQYFILRLVRLQSLSLLVTEHTGQFCSRARRQFTCSYKNIKCSGQALTSGSHCDLLCRWGSLE